MIHEKKNIFSWFHQLFQLVQKSAITTSTQNIMKKIISKNVKIVYLSPKQNQII